MDIIPESEKVDKLDTFLDKFKSLLKKHWGILLLILVGYLFYWFFGLVNEEIKRENHNKNITPVEQTQEEMPVDTNYQEGDTLDNF